LARFENVKKKENNDPKAGLMAGGNWGDGCPPSHQSMGLLKPSIPYTIQMRTERILSLPSMQKWNAA